MKLHEIISALETQTNSVLIESMIPYKKSLLAYYKDLFCSDPVLMVTIVSNAAQYARIEPANELTEAICSYLDDYDCTEEGSENYSEYETICFNSMMLADL